MKKHWLAGAISFMCACTVYSAGFKDVYPTPQVINDNGKTILITKISGLTEIEARPINEALKNIATQKNNRQKAIKVIFDNAGKILKEKLAQKNEKAVDGAYWMSISPKEIKISALSESGKFYAIQTLAQMIELGGGISCGEILDWPDLAFRGTVEGYYGNPWIPEARKEQFRMYGKYKINTFIYGPKDDPYHRNKWAENYPQVQAETLREQIKIARENHVNFVWTIHLGGVFNENDKPKEFAKLLSKLEFMYGLGVRAFGALFDDFGKADAALQSEICNYIVKNFLEKKKDCMPLIMCPSQYNKAWSGGNYLDVLGEKLDPSVNVMWTGNSVCTDITVAGTEWINKRIKRKAFIWWNWPCNDYCRTALCMGETYGLEAGNKGKLSGITGNPMDKPEASKIGLFGIGNWSWNIDAFDSDKTWRDGIIRLYPNPKSMQVFVNHNSDQGPNGHGYRRKESVEFLPVITAAQKEYASTGKFEAKTTEALLKEFAEMESAALDLEKSLPKKNPMLFHEIEYWVRSFAELGVSGQEMVKMVNEATLDGKFVHAQNVLLAFEKSASFSVAQKKRSIEDSAFEGNKQWSQGCKVGGLHVTPFVNKIFKDEWQKLYKQLSGTNAIVNSVAASSYKGISNVLALKNLQANRNGKFVNVKLLEQVTLEPKQYIGIELPEGIYGNYIHLKLNNPDASKQGIIEISQDGQKWEKFNSRNNGQEMQNNLDIKKKIRFFRYINTSTQPIDIRLNQFKFDIPGDAKINSEAAMVDGDIGSFYALTQSTTLQAPQAGMKAKYVMSSVPQNVKIKNDGTIQITATTEEPVNIYEIIWK